MSYMDVLGYALFQGSLLGEAALSCIVILCWRTLQLYVREEHIVGDVVEVSSVLEPGSCSTGEEGR